MQQFWSSTGVTLDMTHVPIDVKNSISCIRNPIDSMASLLAMDYEATRLRFLNRCYEHTLDEYLNSRATRIMFDYILFYKVLNNSQSFIVDYEDMQKNMDAVISSVCKTFNIEKLKEQKEEIRLTNNLSKGYLIKSSQRKIYPKCRQIVSEMVTKECWELYEIAKKRSRPL
jgi:hypothetical protein